ncbi:MAG TPA: mechanosensitive ion channel [Anaerolineales bacterium]
MENQVDVILESFMQMMQNFILFLPKVILALIVFIISLYLAGLTSRLVRRAMERRKTDPEAGLLITKITRWTVIFLGAMVALQQVDFNVTAFLTGLGILGFTVGFALQDVSKNFVAGLLLLIQQPFDVGDSIKVTGFAGTVMVIDLRATEIHTFDGQVVLIPNADVFTNPITNYTRAKKRRVEVSVGVAYESDLEEVSRLAVDAIASVPGLLDEPAPLVHYQAFGPSTIDWTIYYWIDTGETDPFTARDVGMQNIKVAFERANIDMPYPTQRVYVEQLPVN